MRSRLFVSSYDQTRSDKESNGTNDRSFMMNRDIIHQNEEPSITALDDASLDWCFETYEDDFSEFFLPASNNITI